ncbi:MAG TPA: class I SAM-dependent methyltransferase [Roseiflexaceae bacterium]|nr:class I SAM-dependent methyltransferase [Roseiflexaceae bacterium]
MTETATTSAAYDQIAAEYAARPDLDDTMDAVRRRFAARLAAGARVLDAGCGPAHDTAALRRLGLSAIGLDRSCGMLAQARERGLPLLLGDMRRLPVCSDSLDGLWACASFLHIPKRDGLAVLRELHRALRPGGLLFVGVKQGAGERWVEHGGHRRFFSFYQEAELDALLEAAGFAIAERWTDPDSRGRPEAWIGRLSEAVQGSQIAK